MLMTKLFYKKRAFMRNKLIFQDLWSRSQAPMTRSNQRLAKWCKILIKNKVKVKKYRKIKEELDFYAYLDIKISQFF